MSLKFSHPISASFLSVLSKKKPRRIAEASWCSFRGGFLESPLRNFFYPSWALRISPVSWKAMWNANARARVWGVWPPRPILR